MGQPTLFPEPEHAATVHERDPLPPADAAKLRRRAQSQEEKVLAWFREHPAAEMTPFEVREEVLPACPITSVRRALTNLTKAGFLEKGGRCQQERFGVGNRLWRLKR